MKPFTLLLAAVCLSTTVARAADAPSQEVLTPAETARLDAARTAALKAPAVKPIYDEYKQLRKAYQIDRDKFPNERDPALAVQFRKVEKAFNAAVEKQMLTDDPALARLFAKAERKRNEGENATDSDVKNPAVAPITDVPGLPRVLLIGDSISIGYTLEVRKLLDGRANVHRIPVNGGATDVGLAKIDEWLGDGKWDVIHFNFGLHDAKYLSATELRSDRETYVKNLATLTSRMQKTGAKLIFATTTPVPNNGVLSPTRKFDDVAARNELAVAYLREHGVAIDDLYAVVVPRMELIRPGDLHYTPAGYGVLAKAVAESIATQLPK